MTYDTNKRILTLSEVRRRERNEREKIFNEEALKLLTRAVSYYNINYPNSIHENIWKKEKIEIKLKYDTLEKELKSLSEKELDTIYEILTYFHDERQMPKIEDHKSQGRIKSICKKLIPGGLFLDKLYDLYEKQKDINKEIKKLENILDEEREEFRERLEKNKKIKPDYEACELCGKVCKSGAGIKSHMRSKHPGHE